MESYRLGVPVVFEFELKNKKKRKRSVQLDVNWGDPEDVVRNFGEISRLNKKGGDVDFSVCESYWRVKIYIFVPRHYVEKTVGKVSEKTSF